MHDLKSIRQNPELYEKGLAAKGSPGNIKEILDLDRERREILEISDAHKHKRNTVSKKIAELKKNREDASELIKEMQVVSGKIKEYDRELSEIGNNIDEILYALPNIPHESTPIGKDETFNKEISSWGEKPEFDFEIKDHYALGEDLKLFDFKRGSKISGSGFPLYTGMGARLERAMLNFMLDLHVDKHGYTEIFPPFLTNRHSTGGTGQLPKLEDDMYYCGVDDLFLIPTAEVPVTNIYKDEILQNSDLPIYHTAYSACFRREAGSYGKDTRGFQRVHQFNKVEMVKFVQPETSYTELESLLKDAEEVLQLLNLHYRILELCSGDLSFAAAKCYDIEVWSPAENKYLEVSSCSNFENFQARRIGIRYRKGKGSGVEYVHTLNGSGIATPRLMIALLETYQTDEGSVIVPDVLKPYLKTDVIKPPTAKTDK
jgi:seryl-tRNA synthetase